MARASAAPQHHWRPCHARGSIARDNKDRPEGDQLIFAFDAVSSISTASSCAAAAAAGPVEPARCSILLAVLRERHRVVPKEVLLDTVRGNRFVTESALTSRVKAARRGIGEDGHRSASDPDGARSRVLVRRCGRGADAAARGLGRHGRRRPAGPGDPFGHGPRRHPPGLRDHRQRSAAGQGGQLAQSPRLRLAQPGLAALVPASCRAATSCCATTSVAADFSIGTSSASLSMTGWRTSRRSSTPRVWTASRFSGSRRAVRSRSRYAVRHPERVSRGPGRWAVRRGTAASPAPEDVALVDARVEMVRLG